MKRGTFASGKPKSRAKQTHKTKQNNFCQNPYLVNESPYPTCKSMETYIRAGTRNINGKNFVSTIKGLISGREGVLKVTDSLNFAYGLQE